MKRILPESNKEMTITEVGVLVEQLIVASAKGFDEVHEKIDTVTQELRGFKKETNDRFEKVDRQFEKIHERFEMVDEAFGKVRQDIWNLDDKFVTKSEFQEFKISHASQR